MQEDQDNERESGDVAAYAEVDQAWLMGAIESMLFVTDEPVGVLTFADMLQVDPARVQESLVFFHGILASFPKRHWKR